MEQEEKISPRQAAEISSKFYRELTGAASRLNVEEVKYKDGFWYVTLSMDKPGFLYGEKEYKIFKVDAFDSEVESMSIRE